ncbi:2-hydroxychromene-2-carboxylate isomerase [Parahaliea mediterranea]|uniref:2-hydroxychromene-2-carboxylate isomerase n=1 Tax=Parahaliea mediterranea TaxID=651086 RepID=UPI000E2F2DAA|nr:2-hydroxychromene-2-carboxylate isomerase [Parahaliea mediterranea]
MRKQLEFLYDFGSPNAYLAHRVLPDIARRCGAELVYQPVLLGGIFKLTGNASPMQTMAGIRNRLEYEGLETERFVRRHGLQKDFRMNPHFPVNTLQIMRGAVAAQGMGADIYRAYVDTLFYAMWRDGRDMGDVDNIASVLENVGLPAADLLVAAQTQAVKSALLANTENAVERGVFGAPSFFVGTELYFGKDRLRDIEEALGD